MKFKILCCLSQRFLTEYKTFCHVLRRDVLMIFSNWIFKINWLNTKCISLTISVSLGEDKKHLLNLKQYYRYLLVWKKQKAKKDVKLPLTLVNSSSISYYSPISRFLCWGEHLYLFFSCKAEVKDSHWLYECPVSGDIRI